jgi:hypothetical protein
LRALEKFVRENPRAPEGRFLLGFHYLIAGHRDAAAKELLEAVKLTPKDQLAARLLTQAGGTVPPGIVQPPEISIPQRPMPTFQGEESTAEPGKIENPEEQKSQANLEQMRIPATESSRPESPGI